MSNPILKSVTSVPSLQVPRLPGYCVTDRHPGLPLVSIGLSGYQFVKNRQSTNARDGSYQGDYK